MDQRTANRTETLVDAHLAAYCEPDAGRRQQAIARLWNREGRLVDPPFESSGHDGIVQQAIRAARQAAPEMLVITDVCFCEYTSHGH